MKRTCPGCGALIQSENPLLVGYVPETKLSNPDVVCQRCFRLHHYHDYSKVDLDQNRLMELVKKEAQKVTAICLIAECFWVDEPLGPWSWLETVNKPVFLIGTKFDLIDDFINFKLLKNWMVDVTGLPSRQIWPMSLYDKRSSGNFYHFLKDKFSTKDRIMLVGRPNAGKSSFLNKMMTSIQATESPLPGTTVGMTQYKMLNGPTLIDVPGMGGHSALLNLLCPDCLARLTPSKSLQSYEVVLKQGQSILLGGLVEIIAEELHQPVLRLGAFLPQDVTMHKTNAEKSSQILSDQRFDLVSPPCPACYSTLMDGEMVTETVNFYPKVDLTFYGLGWVSGYNGSGKLELRYHPSLTCRLRDQLLSSVKVRKAHGFRA